ncbi:MAG: hypothetical protein IKD88_00905 [Lachnospiraceae bacterium]|nr:hypothetical protein [Lachnospiraceae bacterium]
MLPSGILQFYRDILPAEKAGERFFHFALTGETYIDRRGIERDEVDHDSHDTIEGLAERIAELDAMGMKKVCFSLIRFRQPGPRATYRRRKQFASAASSVWVDIDGLTEDVAAMTDAQRAGYVAARYHLTPDYIVMSGHGLHLYWSIDEVDLTDPEQQETWSRYMRALLVHTHGDPKAQLLTQVLRAPGTHNRKNGGNIPTRLIDQHDGTHDIHRLDWLLDLYPEPTIQQYQEESRAASSAKRAAKRDAKAKNPISKNEEKHPDPVMEIAYMGHIEPRYRMLCRWHDLHNYYARRQGQIVGFRSLWTAMLATTWWAMGMSRNDAIRHILTYFPPEHPFSREALAKVSQIYDTWTGRAPEYNPGWTTDEMAKELCFNAADYQDACCLYGDEARKARKRYREACYRAEAGAMSREDRSLRAIWIELDVRAAIDSRGKLPSRAAQEIADRYGVSSATVRKIRSRIGEIEEDSTLVCF